MRCSTKFWRACRAGVPKPRYSSSARADVEAIRDFSLERFGEAVAAAYVIDLQQTVHAIGARPLAGRDDGDLASGMRSVRCRSHRIFYQIDGGSVVIVRILHHAQDAERALGQ